MPYVAPQPVQALAHPDDLESDDARLARVIGDDCPASPQSRSRLPLNSVDLPGLRRCGQDDLVNDALVYVVEQVLPSSKGLVEMTGVHRRGGAQGSNSGVVVTLSAEQLKTCLQELLAPL